MFHSADIPSGMIQIYTCMCIYSPNHCKQRPGKVLRISRGHYLLGDASSFLSHTRTTCEVACSVLIFVCLQAAKVGRWSRLVWVKFEYKQHELRGYRCNPPTLVLSFQHSLAAPPLMDARIDLFLKTMIPTMFQHTAHVNISLSMPERIANIWEYPSATHGTWPTGHL